MWQRIGQEVVVHTMNPVHRRGPIFYASLPSDPEIPMRPGRNGEEAKRRLISILWDHLMAMDSRFWTFHRSSRGAALPIQVVRDRLGKPRLLLGAHRGPAISFSKGGGRIWAALCGDESDMGIDVAEAVEFQGAYPLSRVFHAQELQHVLPLAGDDLAKASALLWSVKEAVVKALGCAFHLVDPLQIHVCPLYRGDDAAGHGRVYISRALIREGSGTFSNRCGPVLMGAFCFLGQGCGFPSPS